MSRRTAALGSFVAIAVLSVATAANAADAAQKAACTSAYEQGQVLQRHGELRAAREKLLVCGRAPCSPVLRDDCVRWLAEVERAQPSIVVVARAPDGSDLLDVRVVVDGKQLASRLDARAIEIDPGAHVLRFERDGAPPVEQHVVVHEGEKERAIEVRFGATPGSASPSPSPSPPPSSPAPSSPPRPPDTTASSTSQGAPWIAYALAGVGVVTLGGFIAFGVAGRTQQVDHLDACKPHCQQADVDAVSRKYLVADVSLGVSVVAIAASAFFFLSSRSSSSASASLSPAASVGAHGASFGALGRF